MNYRFRYDNNGIPILSAKQIEQLAICFLQKYDPKTLGFLRLVPIEKLLEYIGARDNIETGYEVLDQYKSEAAGLTDFDNKRVLIDEVLANNDNLELLFNFACAHEIAHWELHRFKPITTGDNDEQRQKVIHRIVCDKKELKVCSERYLSPMGLVEWQANSFAAALLMPALQLKFLVHKWHEDEGIRNPGIIYLDDQPQNQLDYARLSESLSKYFHVSKQALRLRLKNLNILKEKPDEEQVGYILKQNLR